MQKQNPQSKNELLSILLAGFWISVSEFLRNELLFKHLWVDHYKTLGLKFETTPVNGFIWFVWSLVFAVIISKLLSKFSRRETLIIAWVVGFLMMWLTLFNLQVLPIALLIFAIPLSLLEAWLAIVIIKRAE